MSVSPSMRHTRRNPCGVCGGADGDRRGNEKRCWGWTTEDGKWCHCARDEHASGLGQGHDGMYAHKMRGSCKCGVTHGADERPRDDILAVYNYRDESGALLFQVVRKAGKRFLQRRPDGDGGWIWQLSGVRRVPYRLPELLAAPEAAPVYLVEGEKDVERLVAEGLVATTNPGGAGKWGMVADSAAVVLRGRDVVVIGDADDAGASHAAEVVLNLHGIARSVRLTVCPKPHKDVSDLLEAGGGIHQLITVDDTAEPEPSTMAPASHPADELAPRLPFDEIWTPNTSIELVVPAMGIAPGPPHLVTGSWYTGKTLYLLSMGLAVAAGRDVFGVHRTQSGRWAHFDHEMGRRHVKRYLQRVRMGLVIDIDELRERMSLHVLPRLNLRTTEALDHYCYLLDGFALATIDPLRAAVPGVDENKSEFREYLDMLAGVSDRTGCSIVVLHHGGKPTDGASRRNTGRGTSAIDDAVQTKFVLTAQEKEAPMLVSHEKTRELDKTLDDFYLRIESGPDSVRLVHMDPEEAEQREEATEGQREQAKLQNTVERIERFFGSCQGVFSGTVKDAQHLIGGKWEVFQVAWTTLRHEGRLRREGPYRTPVWKFGGS